MADRKTPSIMATRKSKSSSTKSDSGHSASLLAGSEEIFDFFCRPCTTDNLHLEAVGYCQNCDDYLCAACYKCHRKTTGTQHHNLLEKADMPKIEMVAKPTDDLREKCPKHTNKLIDYFCKSHDKLCCVICRKTDHGSCQMISHIPVVSYGIDRSDEYKHLMADLKTLFSWVKKQQGIINCSTKDNDKYKSQSLAGIREFRIEVDKLIDKYEKTCVMKVFELHHANSEKLKAASSECQGVHSDVNATIANLDAMANDGKKNQLFVDIKRSKQSIFEMWERANHFTNCRITRYGFHQDEKVKEMLSSLWSMSIGGGTKARYQGAVHVKSKDDINACKIDGIAVLPGGDIVLSAFENKSLTLVDMKLKKVTHSLSLSSPPSDVTNTKPNDVAVSLENEEKIEIYTVTDVLSLSNSIHIGERGFCGMCYADERFILTYLHRGLVKIVDMSGGVLRTISTDENGCQLFINPRYIAVGPDVDVVYVTDERAHTVTTMTLRGHVISKYWNDKLECPAGITIGSDHNVYVCSKDTHTVLQLNASGKFQQILLNGPRYPGAIAYDDTSDRLYISSGTNHNVPNRVTFFQLD